MNISDAIAKWLDHAELVRGWSPATVRGYGSDMGRLSATISDVEQFTLNHVRGALAEAQHLAPATRARMVSAAQSFAQHARDQGWSDGGDMHRLMLPKLPKKVAEHFSEKETAQLFDSLKKTAIPDEIAVRDWALFELVYGAGLRVAEACSMDLDDVDAVTMKIKVTGKGNKQRVLPIGPNQLFPLVMMMGLRNPAVPDETALFLGAKGERMGARAAGRALAEACDKAGLRALSPHALRHSCATHMVDGGADITVVREFLGHESLATTEQYVHVAMKKMVSIYQSAHPRAVMSDVKNAA
ncbi:tyrosine-type recombinase/integrase [Corynebacterium sp. A21]|uniref:tyrosine-type recombinase/integrase n=1 Tax=Corynebacterium sp. A21 TaxID=3457318 RepID=UPI003FD4CC56